MRALKCDNCGHCYDFVEMAITQLAWCRPDGIAIGKKDLCPECLAAVAMTLEDRRNVKIQKKTDPLEDDLK